MPSLIGTALPIARPMLAEARALWHRRGASPLDDTDPVSLDRELDGALDILAGNSASLPNWLVKKVAALASDRPEIFGEEEVRCWLQRDDVRAALKSAARESIADRDIEPYRALAADLYAAQSGDGAWWGAVAFDFALSYLLRTLDAKIPFETRVTVGVVNQRADRLEEMVARQGSTIDAFMALLAKADLIARAEDRGLTIVQIENLLTRFGHAGAPVDKAEKLLLDAADQLQRVRIRLTQLSDVDPHVARLKTDALDAIDQGDLDAARGLLRQAAERDLEAVQELEMNRRTRRLSASDSVAQMARLASAEAAFANAAAEFGRAARIAEPVDLDTAWWHWIDAAEAHARSAQIFPDIAASRAAVEIVRRHNLPLALATGDPIKLQRARYELALDLLDLAERVPEAEAIALRTEALAEARRAYGALDGDASDGLHVSGLIRIGDIQLAIARATSGEAGLAANRAAVADYERALDLAKRGATGYIATCESNLGIALRSLSDRVVEPEATTVLDAAIAAYRRALTIRADEPPADRADLVNLIGSAYLAAGERAGANLAAEMNQTALTLFEEAVASLDPELRPLTWAQTVSNIALAERRLANGPAAPEMLRRAIAHYHAALSVYSPTETPVDWARTRNNLASALMILGVKTDDDEEGMRQIKAAIVELEAALTVRAAIPNSIGWLNVQNNLGLAYRHLATRDDGDSGLEYLRTSVATLTAVVSGWSEDADPTQWASATANLAMSEALLAEKLRDIDLLDQALARLDGAIAMFEREGNAAGLTEARGYRTILSDERSNFG